MGDQERGRRRPLNDSDISPEAVQQPLPHPMQHRHPTQLPHPIQRAHPVALVIRSDLHHLTLVVLDTNPIADPLIALKLLIQDLPTW
ncbi:hypothetical protein AWZ03_006285 [Drosophila navojoa]|uniref:Uncharacterized protein n=1 Tax=Drosophila navojoa TaxID=7232 RepID=A0A484BGA6_DRONA|nr:hypothetical protein AWZ03_006285 [Drosophila navojoa]